MIEKKEVKINKNLEKINNMTISKKIEEDQFYDEVNKVFGIDKNCLTNIGKIYPLTVATNILITLCVTLFMVYIANYFNLLDFKYTVAELFLTAMILFSLWNCILGFSIEKNTYYFSTNTCVLLAMFILPLFKNGPQFIMKQIC